MADIINQKKTYQESQLKAILLTGLTAGTLDILAAIINTSIALEKFAAVQVLRFIASGVFGKDAFTGGQVMVFFGLFFHYIIAFSFTTVYFLFYPRLPHIKYYKMVSGIIYGLIIWLIMNLIVVPLSQTPELQFSWQRTLQGIIILMVCVGIPISIIAGKYYEKKIIQTH